jgi:hypothetical protein
MALFSAAGFERLAVRRFVLPDKRYVDVMPRAPVSGRARWMKAGACRGFRWDRHTAAIHYLYRKPERSADRAADAGARSPGRRR